MSNSEKSESVISVYAECKYSLRKMISKYLNRASDVEDVLQETFTRTFAADKKKSIDFPKLYLFKTAKHLVYNENINITNTLTEYLDDFASFKNPSKSENPLDLLTEDEERALLQQAMATLPEQCRRVTHLRLTEHFAVKDIAVELNLSLSTVEKHLAKGIERCDRYMREFVNEYQSQEFQESQLHGKRESC
ncbi:sigma-70 family RNA polymerase sigma factor [Shewanella avicenniae]|uniref:Sigma-70 family RNA polymerase sigma factor n=1 Tax=Shewanella avicenniae TaxID=2814294 RepID=A0ABX7QNH6_9GAMM|nr:sigma-70 family RNA polymerase sigma factor [Shewanella avicenniae]QSX32572.1 sigma-70 family RNA polymerase sigma factor [Shewanella avicenniae]